jgi:hypothetical protein
MESTLISSDSHPVQTGVPGQHPPEGLLDQGAGAGSSWARRRLRALDRYMVMSIGITLVLAIALIEGSRSDLSAYWAQHRTIGTSAYVTDSQAQYDGHRDSALDVQFKAMGTGQVTTSVFPNRHLHLPADRRVPIRYAPGDPQINAFYAGPGGDYFHYSPGSALLEAIISSALAVALLLLVGGRWLARIRVARSPTTTLLSSQGRSRVMHVNGHWLGQPAAAAGHGPELLWSRTAKKVKDGLLEVHGNLQPNQWLVLREVHTGRWLWPTTKSEPILGTGLPTIEFDRPWDVIGGARILLSAYVALADYIRNLPFFINRDTTGARHSFIGLPRPVLRVVFGIHARRYVRHLQDGLTRQLLRDPNMKNEDRDALVDLRTDGDAFIASLRVHRAFLRLFSLVSTVPVVLGLWYAIFPRASHSLKHGGDLVLPAFVVAMSVALLPLIWLNRGVLRKRSLIEAKFIAVNSPDDAFGPVRPRTWASADLEHQLSDDLGGLAVVPWEHYAWLRRTVGAFFVGGLAFAMMLADAARRTYSADVVSILVPSLVVAAALVLYRPEGVSTFLRRGRSSLRLSALLEGSAPDQTSAAAISANACGSLSITAASRSYAGQR